MNKAFIILFSFLFSTPLFSKTLTYTVENNDQLGTLFLSIGHKKLWAKNGIINILSKELEVKDVSIITPGKRLKIPEDYILFKKNITQKNDDFFIIKKINTLKEYEELLKNENLKESDVAKDNETFEIEIDEEENNKEKKVVHTFNFYPGVGFFLANNSERDQAATTTTFTGLQPIVELKAIYSNDSFGSLSADLLTKKIFNSGESFPLNIDYRLQFVPLWNFTDYFRFAFSHSVLVHSYKGKHIENNTNYKLTSRFFGLGFIVPSDRYQFEFYFEKAYRGETTSTQYTQNTKDAFRIDAEVIYSFNEKWRLIPGINYYNLKDQNTLYELSIFEARFVLAREFEF